ncbi:MmcQ/YjbR family DNA-binding protein [Engelhardtia mirabilis]|uniref:MmcQ/YjbR family DNA-binding protein n=1 Tax=Engelhardtia mirabilis TaxID=2528011 RepID=A0A518BRA9_9BACT|nr:hypothetical protein Pla133_46190 [Planctomycetes bacterium Pla133]QDV03825.1 hypothetical protein Pla86_46170 [Planctomycetes bacterium Pla86]
MAELSTVRRLALALPEASEQGHHGRASFRVGGRIFATVPDADHVNVMLDVEGVDAWLDRAPGALAELTWGSKVCGVAVALAAADEDLLEALLLEAWRRVATQRAIRALEARG